MKKIISLMLIVFCFLALFSCEEEVPKTNMSKEYDTVTDLVAMLAEEYVGSEAQLTELANNKNICAFFKENHPDRDILIDKLYEVMSASEMYEIYAACNTTKWYNKIRIGSGSPMVLISQNGPTCEEVANDIKSSFKNPDSVSVTSASILWKKQENDSKLLDSNEFMIIATVKATNSFGAYVTDEVFVKCTMDNNGEFSCRFYDEVPEGVIYRNAYLEDLGFKTSGAPLK